MLRASQPSLPSPSRTRSHVRPIRTDHARPGSRYENDLVFRCASTRTFHFVPGRGHLGRRLVLERFLGDVDRARTPHGIILVTPGRPHQESAEQQAGPAGTFSATNCHGAISRSMKGESRGMSSHADHERKDSAGIAPISLHPVRTAPHGDFSPKSLKHRSPRSQASSPCFGSEMRIPRPVCRRSRGRQRAGRNGVPFTPAQSCG